LLGQPDERGAGWIGYALYRGVRVTYRGTPHRLRVNWNRRGRVEEVCIVEL
jgi:hypothetical protein